MQINLSESVEISHFINVSRQKGGWINCVSVWFWCTISVLIEKHNIFWYAGFVHVEAIEDYTHKCASIDDNSDVVYAHTHHDDDETVTTIHIKCRVLCVNFLHL